MIYLSILLIFIYFKIARVHYKEEELTPLWIVQHVVVLMVSVLIFVYAFEHMSWYVLAGVSFVSFIAAAMLVTAVQLGIFIDGKPLFGMKVVYQNSRYLVLLLCCLCAILWIG